MEAQTARSCEGGHHHYVRKRPVRPNDTITTILIHRISETAAAPGTTQDYLWRAYGRTKSHLRLELEQDGKVLTSFKKPHRFLKRGTLTLLTPVVS